MVFKTSLVIGGDEQGAVAALRQAEAELAQVSNAAQRAQASAAGMGAVVTRSAGEARVGYMMLGQQAQDVAVMLQGGANIGTIIATQGGHVATAVAMMGGRMSGFASFMAGPWGAAVLIGVSVLASLAQKFFEAANAAEDNAAALAKVQLASSGMASAQSVMGEMFDLTTGKIKAQNAELRLNAQLTAINLRAEALAAKTGAQDAATKSGQLSWSERFFSSNPNWRTQKRDYAWSGQNTIAQSLLQGVMSGKEDPAAVAKWAETADFSRLGISNLDYIGAVRMAFEASSKQARADQIDESLKSGELASGLRRAAPGTKKAGGTKAPNAGAIAEFGEDTAARIAGIRDEFSDIPAQVERANKAMRQLDDIASDIQRKGGKLLNKEELLSGLSAARKAVDDSLNKPFNDFIDAQRESAEVDKLLLAGRDDEAEALKIVLRLQEQQGPLSEAQMNAVLATVQAERRRGMVLRDQRALIQANLDAVYDMRGALEQTVGSMLRGKLSVGSILQSIGNSYVQITSKRIVEAMFGDTLRQLEDQATGQDKIRASSEAFAGTLDDGGKAVTDFAAIVRQARSRISGAASPDNAAQDGQGGDGLGNGDIVVEGRNLKSRSTIAPSGGNLLVDMGEQILRVWGIKLPNVLGDILKSVLGKLETSLPEMMKGAFIGSAASSLVLGKSGSNTGAMLGGAFGESAFKAVAPKLFKSLGDFAGPLGSIAGGLLGGIVGGLFKTTKSGGASIGLDARGNAGVTGTAGNSADLKKQASGWGGTLVSQLDRIAGALGADLGAFNVAIGKRDSGWIKVSASGNASATTGKKVTSDIIYNGKDEGEALMAALGNAIADGAIKGVSAAVQKALTSSSDVEKALQEALKVQDVELAIGGIGAELQKAFKDFERQAAERVRIAREYGFDVTKIEERNAQDRLKLTEKLLAEQVGSLQDLVDQLTSGSLFEGSAVDQRQLLLDKIASAKAAADAGQEGAADKLATLLEQLNQVSKEAYGTTGGFAQDRQTILDAARDTIAKANQRVTEAANATDPALAETNAALDENNNQNAELIALLGGTNSLLGQILGGGGMNTETLAALARTSYF